MYRKKEGIEGTKKKKKKKKNKAECIGFECISKRLDIDLDRLVSFNAHFVLHEKRRKKMSKFEEAAQFALDPHHQLILLLGVVIHDQVDNLVDLEKRKTEREISKRSRNIKQTNK